MCFRWAFIFERTESRTAVNGLSKYMDSISLPISNSSLSLGSSGKDGSQDQEQRTVAECLNELENELERLVPWSCPNRLKVILGRIAMKVQKDKPTPGKIYYSDKWLFWGYDYWVFKKLYGNTFSLFFSQRNDRIVWRYCPAYP